MISLAGIIVIYFSISFIKLTTNFADWAQELRGIFIFFSILWIGISSMITAALNENN